VRRDSSSRSAFTHREQPRREPKCSIASRAPLLIATICFALAFSGCKPRKAQGDEASSLPRNETLYISGRQWGPPASINPLAAQPDWPVISGVKLMYETLFLYDALTGKMVPLLAESYVENDDSIEVVLNPKARWSDGKPVTGHDIKYSFDLGKKHKDIPIAPVWTYLTEVRLPEVEAGTVPPGGHPRRVVFEFNKQKKNPLIILDALEEYRMLPRHVIEPLLARVNGDMNEFLKINFQDPAQAVCSGPYRIYKVENEKIALIRNEDYWGNDGLYGGKKPAPKYVVHPIYKSNDHFSVALQQGRLDVSSTYIPRIWLKQKKGVGTWFDKEPFYLGSAITMLYINVLHPPLNDVKMRRAMAFAINYKDIRELAVSGYSEPLKPGLILPMGLESKYYSEEDARKYGTWFDPERAKATLKEGGYTPVWGPNGELIETRDAQGKKVPTVYIKSPTGWTDWESIVRIAVRSMRSVGIDVRERFVDASLFWGALYTAGFDLVMWTPHSQPTPSKPWSRLDYVMASGEWAPEGERVFKNFGRFNNPKGPDYVPRVAELIELIPTLKGDALVEAYHELNRLYMQLQPTLPLVYRADQLYEFSTRVWDNFPTAKNPYAPPQVPGDRAGVLLLWNIRPKEAN
jgi:peptide/nickel transport system substrate-binding protein